MKRSYYELARKFHPDLHMAHPEWAEPLAKLMETITLAYRTLADDTARARYDEQLAAAGAYQLGAQEGKKQKTAEDCIRAARASFRGQNYGGSILSLREALELEPQSSKCHTLLARSLSAVPQYRREALEHFQRAIELDSFNLAAHFYLGELYEEMKLPWRARLHYEEVVQIDPAHAKALEKLTALDQAARGKRAENSPWARILRRLSKPK